MIESQCLRTKVHRPTDHTKCAQQFDYSFFVFQQLELNLDLDIQISVSAVFHYASYA